MSAEQELRDLFAADAVQSPSGETLAADARRRARETRRVRTVAAGAVLAAAAVLGAVVLVGGAGEGSDGPPAAASSEAAPTWPSEGPAPTGAVPLGTTGDCVEYTTVTLAGQDFAFDGTVVAIAPAPPWNGQPRIQVEVTFEVHEWFRGGPAGTVTVEMDPPDRGSEGALVTAYGIGGRLLVSGAAHWNEDPRSAPLAGGCGFTRYWDPATAAAWAAVFAGGSAGRTGAVPLGANVDCGPAYSLSELARAEFAFDGTVVAIDPVVPADERLPVSVAEVTFDVREWFRGGSAETVTVEMESPTLNHTEPVYEVGDRLLVSGAGGASGPFIGFGACGFIRYWDPLTAAEWAAATD